MVKYKFECLTCQRGVESRVGGETDVIRAWQEWKRGEHHKGCNHLVRLTWENDQNGRKG